MTLATVSAIIQFLVALMKMTNNIFSYFHDQGMIAEGEQRQYVRAALEMATRSKVFRDIEQEYSKMPIEEVKKRMEQDGDFRD